MQDSPKRTLLKKRISHPQITRYEIEDKYPAADVLKVSADVFGTTIDFFLVMGDIENKRQASLKDTKLINQFKKISVPPEEERVLVLKMITAYLGEFNTQQVHAS